MVWFQCEDCGENLKKPKILNHFRVCYASKWSCIDCGQIFGQQSVQGHTQCISEAEKYGPKGQVKAPNGTTTKPKADAKQKPEIDITVGLSERSPWFCSLCNTKATSKQTLLLHADGKKHRAKARAFHASNQQPKVGDESAPNANISTESNFKDELPTNLNNEGMQIKIPSEVARVHISSEVENENSQPSKKRKFEASKNEMACGDSSGELGNGEVIQVEGAEEGKTKDKVKKANHSANEDDNGVELISSKIDALKRIKWKKVIKSSLKSNPEGVLKMRKLKKLVSESMRQSGFTGDESQITAMLEQKIKSSSRFMVDGKYVHLVAKQ